jgi:hypothetical protein
MLWYNVRLPALRKKDAMPQKVTPTPANELEALTRIAKAIEQLTLHVSEMRGDLHVLVATFKSKSYE